MFAEGKPDSLILFTAQNDSAGGWNGIYFHDYSDWQAGSYSLLKYCKIQKANQYNVWCNNTTQPTIDHCQINAAQTYGLLLESSPISITNTTVSNNGNDGIYVNNSFISLSDMIMIGNGEYPIFYNNAYYVNFLTNLEISGNLKNVIAIDGGTISIDRTWRSLGTTPYRILNNMLVGQDGGKCRLTIKPGCIIQFAKNTQLQIGNRYYENYVGYHNLGGELFAEGKSDSLILFTAQNDSAGGWNGIYFHDYSDWQAGSYSLLKYCKIQKANQYNIWCNNTTQPTIDHCQLNAAQTYGLLLESSPISVTNTTVSNNGNDGIYANNSFISLSDMIMTGNGEYPIFYNNAHYVNYLTNIQISGNLKNAIAIDGGTISNDRTWRSLGPTPYRILNNMLVGQDGGKCRLTINPGCIVQFAKNTQLQIGNRYYENYVGYHNLGGELFAEGKSDSLITFTAQNDSIGGWNGIYFHDYSDWQPGSYSLLKYCKIQKASQYNIWCNNTTQPTIEKAIIAQSAGYGLWLDASTNVVKNSTIRSNAGYGVYLTAGSNPVIGNNFVSSCDIYNNSYNIYNNTANNIDMRYNFLGSCDSSYIAKKVWDKSDNSSLGRITFMPFSWLPAAQLNTINVSGKFLYDNRITRPLRNATLTLKDYSNNNTIATTLTNSTGAFTFPPLTLAVPTRINIALSANDSVANVTAVDALLVMKHFTNTLPLLTSNHAFIADVNKSGTINGTDAMMILQRFARIITTFPTGDLQIDCDSVTAANPNFYYNLAALWFGDVNGEYVPSTIGKSPDMALEYEGAINPGSFEEFTMRVKIKNKLELGAISHTFNYPPEFLEVLGVTLISTGENLSFTAREGVLKTGWYRLNPINVLEDEAFLIIRFKSKDLSYQSSPISIWLGDENELADQNAVVQHGVILSAPVIPANITGIEPGGISDDALSFSFFPNPARETVVFSYSLPESANIKITLTDFFGREIAQIADGMQSQGKHRQTFGLASISKGIYFVRFYYGSENIARCTRKLIVQ